MTANQASPTRPGLPSPQTATGRPHDPAGHHATSHRPVGLPLAAAQKKAARYAPLLADHSHRRPGFGGPADNTEI